SWEHACHEAERLAADGLVARRLSVRELVDIEPALEPLAPQLSGAIYYERDEVGDAHQFCVALAARASAEGVDFRFRTEVSALEMQARSDARSPSARKVAAVVARGERFVADRYVIAAGSYSTLLLKQAG